jgi:cytochrome bd ubiquinol oxidase subunit II
MLGPLVGNGSVDRPGFHLHLCCPATHQSWLSRAPLGYDLPAPGAFLLGLLLSTAFGLYPLMLPAVNPAHSLTISNTSASPYGLMVGLVWWILGMLLAMIYFVFTYRLFWGKISLAETEGY